MDTAIIKYLNEQFDVSIPQRTTAEEMEIFLAEKINDLIANDFTQLVQLLYRIDVSEQKLKSLLKQNPNADSGRIIAALVIERQLEKIRSREQFSKRNDNFNEAEKW
ncbi:hypothetical protein BH11BAC4_BH11BAC4_19070 [soil metagenome]